MKGGGSAKRYWIMWGEGGHAKMMDYVENEGLVSFPLDYWGPYGNISSSFRFPFGERRERGLRPVENTKPEEILEEYRVGEGAGEIHCSTLICRSV